MISSPSQTAFQVIAYNPALGTNNGQGITRVLFHIQQLTGGSYVYNSTESIPAYCAFGGDGPCSTTNLTAGTYRMTVTVQAPGFADVVYVVEFTVE